MTSTDQLRWTRVRDRLRAEVGDDIYSSWFARMELEGSEGDTVKLSVPTRFLKSRMQSHYAERMLACWQAEDCAFTHRADCSLLHACVAVENQAGGDAGDEARRR